MLAEGPHDQGPLLVARGLGGTLRVPGQAQRSDGCRRQVRQQMRVHVGPVGSMVWDVGAVPLPTHRHGTRGDVQGGLDAFRAGARLWRFWQRFWQRFWRTER